jgi:hypothetical protein
VLRAHAKPPAGLPTLQECRERIEALRVQRNIARALCERAADIRQYNAELREFLREARLTAYAWMERRLEEQV